MATFSTNQVKHLYVAKALDTNLDTVGDVAFAAAGNKDIVMNYVGNDGVVRSDIINLDNLIYAKAIKASTMDQYLDSTYVACGSAVANQSYILKVIFNSFSSPTDDDKGFVFAEYTAKSGDATKNILAGLAVNLAKNATKAAYNSLINVYVTTQAAGQSLTLNTNAWKVEASDAESTVAGYGSLAGIVIEAAEQPWALGKEAVNFLRFDVFADKIISSGVETAWATITKGTTHPTAALHNSKKIADLEWFCMGERGDMYRDISWPDSFTFTPIVNPAATYGYHVLELAFYYAGDAEDVQKSPKEILLVVPAEGATTYTAINGIIGTASSGASAGTLNKAIYDSGSTAYVAQLS